MLARAVAVMGLFQGGQVQAGPFLHGLYASLTASYDSNLALSASDASGLWRYTAAPAYTLTTERGADVWNARLGLGLERSSDTRLSRHREDPSASVSWQRQTPLGGYGLSARYEEASTRGTEFLSTGLVSVDATRKTTALTANWRNQLTERTTMAANGSYQSQSYEGGTFTDYSTPSLSLTLSHDWLPTTSYNVSLALSRQMPEVGRSSTSTALSSGLSYSHSARLNANLRLGLTRTRGQSDSDGWTGAVQLRYQQGPRTALTLGYDRSVTDSGLGGYIEADNLSGSLRHDLSENLSTGLDLNWRENRSGSTASVRQIGTYLNRALDTFWSVQFRYQYRQRHEVAGDSADSHGLSLLLSYAHPQFLSL